jgi:hypothetical protein
VGIDLSPAVAKENLAGLDQVIVEPGDLMGDLSGINPGSIWFTAEAPPHADPEPRS